MCINFAQISNSGDGEVSKRTPVKADSKSKCQTSTFCNTLEQHFWETNTAKHICNTECVEKVFKCVQASKGVVPKVLTKVQIWHLFLRVEQKPKPSGMWNKKPE